MRNKAEGAPRGLLAAGFLPNSHYLHRKVRSSEFAWEHITQCGIMTCFQTEPHLFKLITLHKIHRCFWGFLYKRITLDVTGEVSCSVRVTEL